VPLALQPPGRNRPPSLPGLTRQSIAMDPRVKPAGDVKI
jgi:hypothetical protein